MNRNNMSKAIDQAPELIGDSLSITNIKHLIELFAPTDDPVPITGETGTGKEIVAHLLHHRSHRRAGPFVPLNCGAFPDQLIDDELFGHVKGAFSGASEPRTGLLESADTGTIFLDEVGEMSPPSQVKLLRFLQDHEFRRLGSNKLIRVDSRIVAATNRDLEHNRESSRFREDLLGRLQVCEIVMPPLRERAEDIRLLVTHFATLAAHKRESAPQFTEEAMGMLEAYAWPRNVRELFAGHACNAVAEKLVDISFDLRDRQLEHDRRLLSVLIVDDGKDRQNEFDEAQITELLRGGEFALSVNGNSR